MNQHSTIKPPKVADELRKIIDAMRVINASGDLGDAPTDLLNDLDAGDNAARELLEWLEASEERALEEARENRPSIYASELAQIAYWGRFA